MGDSLTLWSIASRLRAGRYAGGALRLDGTKMCYTLDRDGNPVAAAPYVQQVGTSWAGWVVGGGEQRCVLCRSR